MKVFGCAEARSVSFFGIGRILFITEQQERGSAMTKKFGEDQKKSKDWAA